jgi:hypothetical protein
MTSATPATPLLVSGDDPFLAALLEAALAASPWATLDGTFVRLDWKRFVRTSGRNAAERQALAVASALCPDFDLRDATPPDPMGLVPQEGGAMLEVAPLEVAIDDAELAFLERLGRFAARCAATVEGRTPPPGRGAGELAATANAIVRLTTARRLAVTTACSYEIGTRLADGRLDVPYELARSEGAWNASEVVAGLAGGAWRELASWIEERWQAWRELTAAHAGGTLAEALASPEMTRRFATMERAADIVHRAARHLSVHRPVHAPRALEPVANTACLGTLRQQVDARFFDAGGQAVFALTRAQAATPRGLLHEATEMLLQRLELSWEWRTSGLAMPGELSRWSREMARDPTRQGPLDQPLPHPEPEPAAVAAIDELFRATPLCRLVATGLLNVYPDGDAFVLGAGLGVVAAGLTTALVGTRPLGTLTHEAMAAPPAPGAQPHGTRGLGEAIWARFDGIFPWR